MHPPGIRMANHMNPNVSKPQHAVGAGGGGMNVGGPNVGGNMMTDWPNIRPGFQNQANNNLQVMRSPNPNQMLQPNQMQGNPVRANSNWRWDLRELINFNPHPFSNKWCTRTRPAIHKCFRVCDQMLQPE